MVSKRDVERRTEEGRKFVPAILSARYHHNTDRVELVTPLCTLLVDRAKIDEFRQLSPTDMDTILVSAVGIHIEAADIDINSAGLITFIARELEKEVADSF
jgi:hypothetical protein